MSNKMIKTKILSGFRDMLPGVAKVREEMFEKIRVVFRRFGFVPLETPTLEYASMLLGKYGEEAQKLLYCFKDNGGREVVMRYDLTVPLARVVAMYDHQLPMPFKRYQMAPVWRADRPQKGRYREFWQCDVDVVGSDSMLADAECIMIAVEVLRELGLENFVMMVNNRKVLNGLIEALGIDKKQTYRVLQALDKFLKIGAEGVAAELAEEKMTGKIDEATKQCMTLLPLEHSQIEKIIEFAQIKGSNTDILAQLEEIVGKSESGALGVAQLKEVFAIINTYGVPAERVKIDLSIARGLEYYTGTVFETFVQDLPSFGSVMSGGRFDKLIGIFMNRDVPAVGISLGLDRLLAALGELGKIETSYRTADVMVTQFNAESRDYYLDIVHDLREAGINTELFLDPTINIRVQLAYANKIGVPLVVIAGSREIESGQANIKDMINRTEKTIDKNTIVAYVHDRLSS